MICQRVGCLPGDGGLFDQDPKHVRRLEKVYQAVAKWEKEELDRSNKRSGA